VKNGGETNVKKVQGFKQRGVKKAVKRKGIHTWLE
jgi:hypothetical protein